MLTEDAARDLGRVLRTIRQMNDLTLRDVAKRSGLSSQYAHNLERGERQNASPDALERYARGAGIPQPIIADLVCRAQVISALQQRGCSEKDAGFIWRGVEARMRELGHDTLTELADVVAEVVRARDTHGATLPHDDDPSADNVGTGRRGTR